MDGITQRETVLACKQQVVHKALDVGAYRPAALSIAHGFERLRNAVLAFRHLPTAQKIWPPAHANIFHCKPIVLKWAFTSPLRCAVHVYGKHLRPASRAGGQCPLKARQPLKRAVADAEASIISETSQQCRPTQENDPDDEE